MTAHTPIVAPATDDCWEALTGAANQWRGAAIQLFAQAELAVSETLERLSSTPERGKDVALRRLVGHRFADLAEALGGPFAAEGAKASEALTQFSRHDGLRPLLCHGVAKVLQDRNGRLAIIFRLMAVKGKSVESNSRMIEQSEAEQLLRDLQSDSRALKAALQSLRDRLPA